MTTELAYVGERDEPGGDLAHWTEVVRGEYLEMPGLQLSEPQIERLWGLDAPTRESVLRALVGARFLRRTPRHTYVRMDLGS